MKDKIRSGILRASKGAAAELKRKGLPATSTAVAKLGAATFAIGKSVTGWTDDFDRALRGASSSPAKASSKKRKGKRKAKASSKRKGKGKRKAKASSKRKGKRKGRR